MKTSFTSLALLSLSLAGAVHSADIEQTFQVALGDSKGSCEEYKDKLNPAYEEALAIAQAGADGVDEVIQKTSENQNTLRMLFMFFDLNGLLAWIRDGKKLPRDTRKYFAKARHKRLTDTGDALTTLATTLDDIANERFDNGDVQPRLYCGDDFLQQTTHTWRDEEDEVTGVKEWKETQDPIGNDEAGKTEGYWHLDAHKYIFADGVSGKGLCEGTTRGFTLKQSRTVVLCPSAFELSVQGFGEIKNNDWEQAGPGKELYNDFLSLPGVLLHELTHFYNDGIIDAPAVDNEGNPKENEVSYGYVDCANLGGAKGWKEAIFNADTLHLFALSQYMKRWDWAMGKSEDALPIEENQPAQDEQ